MEYEKIIDYGNNVKIKFLKCGHEGYIKKEHFESGEFICNICSGLYDLEHMYISDKGIISKTEITKKCRICNKKDALVKLISVPKYNEDKKMSFWYYHNDCLEKYGMNEDAMCEFINNDKNKNKSIVSHIKKQSKPGLPQSILNNINKNKILNNDGDIVDVQIPMQVINKSIYKIDSIEKLNCIYSIHNIKNNKRYIGSTLDLSSRIEEHFKELTLQTHHSYKLQNDFNLFKQTSFRFEILEVISSHINNNKILHLTEQKYIDISNSCEGGYNIHPIAGFYGNLNEYKRMCSEDITIYKQL